MRKRLTEEQKGLIRDKRMEGLTYAEISALLQINVNTILTYASKAKLSKIDNRHYKVWTKEKEDKLIYLYDCNLSCQEISEIMGMTISSVTNRACLLRRQGRLLSYLDRGVYATIKSMTYKSNK